MDPAKHIIIANTGFGLNLATLRHMQKAYSEPLEAFAKISGHKTVLAGFNFTYPDAFTVAISSGFISYDGAVIPFVGGTIPFDALLSFSVTIDEVVVTGEYDVDVDNDGQRDILPKYSTRTLSIGTGGSIATFPFSELIHLKTLKELSAIISNVQADWNVMSPTSPAYILNRPTKLAKVLWRGSSYIGNLVNTQLKNIFFPSVGTINYMVVGTMKSTSANYINDGDHNWAIKSQAENYFEIVTHEYGTLNQALLFEYMIISVLP